MTDQNEKELRQILQGNPGDPAFASLGSILLQQNQLLEALQVCLGGLSENAECHLGRLILAHTFFRLGYLPFAAREIEQLCRKLPENGPLKKLYQKLNPGKDIQVSHESPAEEIEVADAEFEIDALSLLEVSEKKR